MTSLPPWSCPSSSTRTAASSRPTPTASTRTSASTQDRIHPRPRFAADMTDPLSDEACANLASLKFSQSNRSADPKDPSRIITTTTTTTFSMTREMAKGICQHFMDAHLIENAADLNSLSFRDRGVYMITPKGLHILERFITKNGISADHLLPVFASQPICMKLLHLERRSQDDEIIITKSVVEVLFRRFIGREPNTTKLSDDDLQQQYHARWYNKAAATTEELDWSLGLPLRKLPSADKKIGDEYHFSAVSATEWLCDYSTCVGVDEASELAGQFVRYGLITLVSDKGKVKENNVVVTVRAGGAGGGAGAVMVSRSGSHNLSAGLRSRHAARSRVPRDRQGHLQSHQGRHGRRSLGRIWQTGQQLFRLGFEAQSPHPGLFFVSDQVDRPVFPFRRRHRSHTSTEHVGARPARLCREQRRQGGACQGQPCGATEADPGRARAEVSVPRVSPSKLLRGEPQFLARRAGLQEAVQHYEFGCGGVNTNRREAGERHWTRRDGEASAGSHRHGFRHLQQYVVLLINVRRREPALHA